VKSVIHFVDLTFLTPVARLNLLQEKVHGLAVPTSGSSTKKILAENLGQVVQDVKFEFSRTEKSTLGQAAEAGKSKVLVQNNILLKITDY